ncbi:MAG: patatin-like phospholipase family protein [Ginsengibacter sp.]
MKVLLLLLVFPFCAFSQNNYNYKNLVLEGGGIRGLAYPGAVKVLEEKGIIQNIEKVAGTSAGAITALMIGLDYNSHEMDSVFRSLKIQQFNDGKNIFGKIRRLKKEYGVFKGEKFEVWLSDLIKFKTGNANTTFAELHRLHQNNNRFKDVYCTGTNITKQEMQIFSWEQTPVMQLKTAIHISGCIPVYYKPVAIDSSWNKVSVKNNKNKFDLYVDGGMMSNFPINIFDSCLSGIDPFNCKNIQYNPQTLGLKLERPEQIQQFDNGVTAIAPYNVSSLNNYGLALINLLQELLARKTPGLENEKGRTIYISYGNVFGKIRKVSDAEKTALYNDGVMAAEKFFNSPGINHNR